MAVQQQTPFKEYTANGVTADFDLNFDCEKKEHLIVEVDEVEAPVGAWSFSNGKVVFNTPPAAGKKLTFKRNTPVRRDKDFKDYDGSFRSNSVNKEFDQIWWKLQELGVADLLLKLYVDKLDYQQQQDINAKDLALRNLIQDLKNYTDTQDNILHTYFENLINKQGVSLQQLEQFYDHLLAGMANIATEKGWLASLVVDASGKSQQEINNGFTSVNEMLAIENPYSGMRVFVKSRLPPIYGQINPFSGGGEFIYMADKAHINDGGVVINGYCRVLEKRNVVNVDWFGADSTGAEESSEAFKKAGEYLTKSNVSNIRRISDCGTIEMSSGTYRISEVVMQSGVTYQGAGIFATLLQPYHPNKYMFIQEGCKSLGSGDGKYDRMCFTQFRDFSCGKRFAVGTGTSPTPYPQYEPAENGGAFDLQYFDRCTFQNIFIYFLDGTGFNIIEGMDSYWENVNVIATGNVRDPNDKRPAIHIDRGSDEVSNALRFQYLRLERNPISLHTRANTRHCVFSDIKIEGGDESNIIEGGFGIVFDNTELTWSHNDKPMFIIRGDSTNVHATSDSSGIVFNAPQCISPTHTGWYFDVVSGQGGQVEFNNPFLRSVKTFVKGGTYTINGGTSYDSGPDLVYMDGRDCVMRGAVWTACRNGANDGTEDVVKISGKNCVCEDNYFTTFASASGASNSDGRAFINITSTTAKVQGNRFGGTKQCGIRTTNMAASGNGLVRDNRIVSGADIGRLYSDAAIFPEYSLTTKSESGIGVGTIESLNDITVADGAFGDMNVFNHGTLVILNISNTMTAILLGTGAGSMVLVSTTDPKIKTGTGTSGDGNIYVNKSGWSNIRITNYSGASITARTTKISTVKT